MFKLIQSFDDSLPEIELPIEHLFNPALNKLWQSGFSRQLAGNNSYPRICDMFKLLKSLYTKNNILYQPYLMIDCLAAVDTSNRNTFNEFVSFFVNAIPEEDLWTLAFMRFNGYIRENVAWQSYGPHDIREVSTTHTGWRLSSISPNLVTQVWPATTFTGSGLEATYKEHILKHVKKIKDKFEASGLMTCERQFYPAQGSFCLAHLMPPLLNYVTNEKMFTRSASRTTESPSTIFGRLELASSDDVRSFVKASVERHHHFTDLVVGIMSFKYDPPITKADRTALHTVFSYSTSPCDMLKWPITLKGEVKPVLYGVELEVSTNYTMKRLIEACNELFLIGKQDGSITGSMGNRVELVTVPCSLRAQKREWAHFFSKLDYEQFDTSKDTNNGMHVHIDRTAFVDEKHIRNLAWLVNNPANYDFWLAVSERNDHSMRNYATTANFGTSSKVRSFRNTTQVVSQIRGAINVRTNKPTIEVRLFRGIVSYASVLKNLECVDAMYNYTMSRNITELTLKAFLAWLDSTPSNKYPVFKKFVAAIPNMKKIIARSEVREIIFNAKTPEKIIQILDKSKFKITQEHILALNKTMKKRSFRLNKATGKVEAIFTNESPVAHLNRELEKRFINMAG